MFGALMVCAGLALSRGGEVWQLYVGHGLLIGLLGNGAINAPLYVYVTRWFERRRGTALALIASGQYVAGAFWPPLFERSLAAYGWQPDHAGLRHVVIALVVVPLAALFLQPPPPEPPSRQAQRPAAPRVPASVLGLPPIVTFSLLAGALFLCCVPMAMPASHLIALCSDIGLSPARGAMMLSLLLACAFVSRQFWGWMSDRIGGLKTLVIGSAGPGRCDGGIRRHPGRGRAVRGRGRLRARLRGLIPAYILTARQLFPASEASWRVPTLLLTGMCGMAPGAGSPA